MAAVAAARGGGGAVVLRPVHGGHRRASSRQRTIRCSTLHDEQDVGVGVAQFKMSDFELCSHVSIGLAGRRDEVVFEAIVRNSESPLQNSRVVLRQLAGCHAQRRGRRALQVVKKLGRRQYMYESYATRIHGYIPPHGSGCECAFTLVHGYYGSYSLEQWLLQADWLPALEGKLALDEECVKRVGDDTTGGPTVSRQLRLIRMLMRDLLIGVNYLHSHGLAHTELRLENVHISCVDRHIKVGILGNAADFYDNSSNYRSLDGNIERRKLMIAFDIRCVGFMMAKMVLRELMDPSIFMKFKSFLTVENNSSSLREFLLPIIYKKTPAGSIGLQMQVETSKQVGNGKKTGQGEEKLCRTAQMKFDFKGVLPETKITSYWGNVGDTNLGHVDLEDFKKKMHGPNPIELAKKMVKNGIAQAVGFPPTVQCPELIIKCTKHYGFDERIGPQGRIMENFTEEALAEAFEIPSHSRLTMFTLEATKKFYIDSPDKCLEIINNKWANKTRQHFSKLPKNLFMCYFYNEYGDMVTLLSRIMGLEKAAQFEDWMFYVIEEIEKGTNFHWAKL